VITLKDTFNGHEISRHRSVKAAVQARGNHSRMIARVNGKNSFVRYSIRCDSGADISEEIFAAEESLAFGGGKK
jgi:hypothetical protein